MDPLNALDQFQLLPLPLASLMPLRIVPHQLDSMRLEPLNVPDQFQLLPLLLASLMLLPTVPHPLDSMLLMEPLNVPDQSQMLLLMLLLTLPLQLHAMLMEIAKVTIWSAVKPPLKPTLNSKVTMKPLSI